MKTALLAAYHRVMPQAIQDRIWQWRQLTARPGPMYNAALRAHFGKITTHPMYRTWYAYAASSNDRGKELVQTLTPYTTIAHKRALDIGSAHGGVTLAFAWAGAEAVGVEIDPQLMPLSSANLLDYPDLNVTVRLGDITEPAFAVTLGHFDIITAENVIEHTRTAQDLLDAIAALLASDGVAHLTIPNPYCLEEVRHDGHYGIFGLTLLPKPEAIAYWRAAGNDGSYDVGEYTLTYPEYQDRFERAGLTGSLINPWPVDHDHLARLAWSMKELTADCGAFFTDYPQAASYQPRVRQALEALQDRFQQDYHAYLAATGAQHDSLCGTIMHTYYQPVWKVILRPVRDAL
jgi:SAM-dependent methyltransferase